MTSNVSLDLLFKNTNPESSNEGFAIHRTISRLNEIQTLAYFNEPHVWQDKGRVVNEL